MPIHQAVLLAAGLGTRLRPLTLTTPKPLLPLDGACLIDHQLRYLARSGVTRVAINLHHLGEKIRAHVGDGARFGVAVVYSEEPEILGTGGGLRQAAALLDEGPILVLNADALLAADLAMLAKAHLASGAAATMVLHPLEPGMAYKPVATDGARHVTGFGRGTHFYTGLQAVGPALLRVLPPAGTVSCLIEDGYLPCLKTGVRIGAFVSGGYFNDLGTPDRYAQARLDIERGNFHLLVS